MKLRRITLENWRSFNGTLRDIEFAHGTTVFVGENGAGKTALLNAFVWCLYGMTTQGFRRASDLMNHQARNALAVGVVGRVSVTVVFDHNNYEYEVTRSRRVERTGGGTELDDFQQSEPSLRLVRSPKRGINDDVKSHEGMDAEAEIRAVLPPGLHPFFFFPAENIGKDIEENDLGDTRAKMQEAIDVLLGIRRYDMALDVLEGALDNNKLRAGKVTDNRIAQSEAEADDAREAWQEANRRLRELPSEISTAREMLSNAEDQLERTERHRDAIAKKRELEGQIRQAETAAAEAIDAQKRVLNERPFDFFGGEVLTACRHALDEAYDNNEIPPKISAGMLDELIHHRKNCICGTKIGDRQRKELATMREAVVEDAVAERASNLRARVVAAHERLTAAENSAVASFMAASHSLKVARDRKRALQTELEDYLTSMPPDAHGDPDDTLAAFKRWTRKVNQLEAEREDLEGEVDDLRRKKDAAQKEVEKLRRRADKFDVVAKAKSTLNEVQTCVSELQRMLRGSARADVEREMNALTGPVFARAYDIRLDDRFRINVYQDGSQVAPSSSELAWSTFAFVSAIASLMPTYQNLESVLDAGAQSGDRINAYPVVLDAPFSPFGPEYAREFSEVLPDLVAQSIIIIRDDQVGYIDGLVRDPETRSYVLLLHTPNIDDDQTIEWKGRDVPYVKSVDDEDAVRTTIEQLP